MTIDSPERLVSFAVFAYQQEPYVREAVEGALSQDYGPLEIILSDDCSTDGTFEIMRRMAADYHGPHQIILNRNEHNLGPTRHVEHCVRRLARGQLVVFSGGDDRSMPERTKISTKLLKNSTVKAAFTNAVVTDQEGREQGPWSAHSSTRIWGSLERALAFRDLSVWGCTLAIRRELICTHPPIRSEVFQEDVLLPHRALFDGHVVYAPAATVRYRRHPGALWSFDSGEKQLRFCRNQAAIWEQLLEDYNAWSQTGRQSVSNAPRVRRLLRKRRWEAEIQCRAHTATGLAKTAYRCLAAANYQWRLNFERSLRLVPFGKSYTERDSFLT